MTNIELIDLGARVLMAAVFVWSGVGKLQHPDPLSGLLKAHGYAVSPGLVRLCGLCEVAAAAMLVAGVAVWATCLALAVFVFVSNVMVNNFWAKTGMEAGQAKQRAIPSAGMIVGLLFMAGVAYLQSMGPTLF